MDEQQPQGLAAQSLQQQPQQGQGGQAMSEQELMQIIAEIIKLLQSGVTAQELEQKGVPKELIQAAMQQMQQQAQQQQPNQPSGPMGGGLAEQQGMMQ